MFAERHVFRSQKISENVSQKMNLRQISVLRYHFILFFLIYLKKKKKKKKERQEK